MSLVNSQDTEKNKQKNQLCFHTLAMKKLIMKPRKHFHLQYQYNT